MKRHVESNRIDFAIFDDDDDDDDDDASLYTHDTYAPVRNNRTGNRGSDPSVRFRTASDTDSDDDDDDDDDDDYPPLLRVVVVVVVVASSASSSW